MGPSGVNKLQERRSSCEGPSCLKKIQERRSVWAPRVLTKYKKADMCGPSDVNKIDKNTDIGWRLVW